MCCGGRCTSEKLDDLLSYSTPKVATVKDWRIGLFFWIFRILILVYVVVYTIIFEKGYQRLDYVSQGSIVTNARAPPFGPPSSYAYCCIIGSAGCPATDLSKLPCLYEDEFDAQYPSVGEISITLATRQAVLTQKRDLTACPLNLPTDPTCIYTNTTKTSYYVAGFENYSVRVRHSVSGETINVAEVSTRMNGQLVDDKDNVLRSWPVSDKVNINGVMVDQSSTRDGDYFLVSDLLKYASVDLSAASAHGEPYRYNGMNIVVYVNYAIDSAIKETLKYTYKVKALKEDEFKAEFSLASAMAPGTQRTIVDMHSVRFLFVQGGVVGVFSLKQLILSIMSGLGIIAVAGLVVDTVMTTILRNKKTYKEFKYDISDSFTVMRQTGDTDARRDVHSVHNAHSAQLKQLGDDEHTIALDVVPNPSYTGGY